MKINKWLTLGVASIALALQPTQSHAGAYLAVDGGAFILGDLDFNNLRVGMEDGYGFNLAIGARGDSGLGLEIQSGYYTNDFSGSLNVLGSNVNLRGDITSIPLFVNATYKADLIGPLAVELGAGVGIIFSTVEGSASARVAGRTIRVGGKETGSEFGIQGLAGLHLGLGSAIALKAGYRYFRFVDSELNAHFIGAGLVFNF